MRSEFDNLRTNPHHEVKSDANGEKQIVKVYRSEHLIAKRITLKKLVRYFAVNGYQQYISDEIA